MVVYASHGMGPADHGVMVVADVLERMGLVAGNRRRRRLAAMVPGRVRGWIRRAVDDTVLQAAGLTFDRQLGS